MNKHLSRIISGLAALALALTCCIGVTACGTQEPNPEEVIRELIASELEPFKELDEETMGTLTESLGAATETLESFGITGEDMVRAVFGGFDYEIGNVTVDGDSATAETSLTFKDVEAIPGEIESAMTELASDPEILALATDEEALYARLGEEMLSVLEGIGTKTSTVQLDFTKTDDGWVPDEGVENAITSALAGNLAAYQPTEEPETNDEDPTPTASDTAEEPAPIAPDTSAASVSQQNALESAASYLNYSHFSYTGLIDQLEFEGFSTEDATWAVDRCGADWNAQALGQAGDYLDYSAFSYTGLIDQLEFEGFTTEQATYAVDSCGADWNEQAAKSAQQYLDYSSFSRDELIGQLEFEGFTHDQAVFGVDSVGL